MLANVFTKTIRDRVNATLIGTVSVGLMLIFAMVVYRDVDTSFYFDLPPAVLELFGIPAQGDSGTLAFSAMFNYIGVFVLAGLAITVGASAIAGEERAGTLGLLLGNPLSRRSVLLSKALALLTATGAGALILWFFSTVVPDWVDVDMSGIQVGAVMIALFTHSLFYGFLALAIGSWTGKRGLASGVAVGVMVAGYLGAALLPLIDSVSWLARIFPWYYFSSSQPVINGVDWAHMAVLFGATVVCFALAWVGIVRRDLREKGTDTTIVDRLRANPRTQKMIERLAGQARVSRISIKTTSDFQTVFVICAALMFYLSLIMGPFYGWIPQDFITVIRDFPDVLIAMIGGADMSTAAGFIQAEVFSITGPIAFIVVTAMMGSRAVAGEEENHTMDLLLTNPVSRSHVITEKVIAMVAYALLLGLATFLGTWVGVLLAGIEGLSASPIAATSLLCALLALVFGGVALVVGAATGRPKSSGGVTAGIAVLAYFMFTFFPMSATFEPWAKLSPFNFYLGSDPLANGMAWGDAAVLAVTFVVLVAISIPLFQRRDLRG